MGQGQDRAAATRIGQGGMGQRDAECLAAETLSYKQQNRTVFIKNTRRVSSHRHLAEPVRVPQVGGGWSCSLCLLAAAGFGPEQFSSGG
jgi:hypothetical protein